MQQIETESIQIVLKLNKNKCEHISISSQNRSKIKFRYGTTVNKMEEVKYLGCMINDNGDSRREVRKKARHFLENTDNTMKLKIMVFNLITRTKIM